MKKEYSKWVKFLIWDCICVVLAVVIASRFNLKPEYAADLGIFFGIIVGIIGCNLSIFPVVLDELPLHVSDKTDGREIPDATRTDANNAGKSDISKKRGISATKDDQTTTLGHSTGRQPHQQ